MPVTDNNKNSNNSNNNNKKKKNADLTAHLSPILM
jgi:hypothetical protein